MSPTELAAEGSPPTFYRLEPVRFAEHRRELVIRLSIVMPLVLVGLLYLAWHFDKERRPVSLVVIPVVVGWVLYRQFKDERNKWESLVFEFRDGKLIRRLDKYPVLELMPNEVRAILESPRGIIIESTNRQKRMF